MKKIISIIIALTMLLTSFSFAFANNKDSRSSDLEKAFYSKYCPTLDNDIELLKKDYKNLSEDAWSQGAFFNLSLDEYLSYRNDNVDIEYESFYSYSDKDEMEIEIDEVARSGGDAFYLNTGYSCPSQATYSNYDLLWNIYRGDIFIEDDASFNGYIGHAGIVEGTFYDATNRMYYIRVVEAIIDGVRRGIICDERINDKNLRLYRVNSATEDEVDSAASFAVSQIGKRWYWHEYCNNRADHLTWYCSELVWAGYYNAGVDIFPDAFDIHYILPYALEESSYLSSIII